MAEPEPSCSYYLMKAEPDSRIVKGKDVKFSIDDFEKVKVTAWEGVRNYQARNFIKGMKVHDKVLFYHSNTKNLGIMGFAEIAKEAYPDHTAWDKDHPYYDEKTKSDSPRWYMVDVRFVARAAHSVPLALLRHISTLIDPPVEMAYLTKNDLKAIKDMALLNRGRLSVQQVDKAAWDAIFKIATKGYEGLDSFGSKPSNRKKRKKGELVEDGQSEAGDDSNDIDENAEDVDEEEEETPRSSSKKRKTVVAKKKSASKKAKK